MTGSGRFAIPVRSIAVSGGRVAITGVTGLLGCYLVRHLGGAGHPLRCWYRPGSDRSGLAMPADSIERVPGSLGDEASVGELVRGANAVVHAAVPWEGRRTPAGELTGHRASPSAST